MTEHEKYEEYMSLYADGLLPEAETAELMAHLEECPVCSALFAVYKDIKGLFDDDIEPPQELKERVMASVNEINSAEKKKKKAGRVLFLRIGTLAACLALVLVGIRALPAMGRSKSADSAVADTSAVTASGSAPQYSSYSFSAVAGSAAADEPYAGEAGADNSAPDEAVQDDAALFSDDGECVPAETAPDAMEGFACMKAEDASDSDRSAEYDETEPAAVMEPDAAWEFTAEGVIPPELKEEGWPVYPAGDGIYNMYIPLERAKELAENFGWQGYETDGEGDTARVVFTAD